jgi:hypothetical protein
MNSSSRDPIRQYTFVGRRRNATGRSNGVNYAAGSKVRVNVPVVDRIGAALTDVPCALVSLGPASIQASP